MRFAEKHARALLALPLLLYAALPTRGYYWDGITFAILAEDRAPLKETLHPSHLMYATVGVWLYRAAAGLHIRALFLLQSLNALLAGLAIVLVYRALERRGITRGAAIAGALAFGFAATWWKFATDANAYIPSVFLVLCANDFLERRRGAVLGGLAHAGAMMFHELAIFFLPVAWMREDSWRERLSYTAAALGPVSIAYVLAYREVTGVFRFGGFLRWIVAYTPDAGFSFHPLRNVALTLNGTLRLFFGGRLAWVQFGPGVVIGIAALLAVAIVLLARVRRLGGVNFSAPPRDLALWLGLTAAFLFFWMPQNTFYRLFYLPPLLLILWFSTRAGRPPATAPDPLIPALVCGVLFCWNLTFLVYPQSRAENNAPLRFALAQHDRWPPGTPVVFHRFHPDLWTISYFNPQASWIGFDKLNLATLDASLASARERHQPLWLEATAHDFLSSDPRGQEWLARHESEMRVVVDKDARHEYRFYRVN